MNPSRLGNGSIYNLQMELKGLLRAFPLYGRSRIMDHVTWDGKHDICFIFLTPNPMYAGCNGETHVYASCLIARLRIWKKNVYF
jgi:hypothetical protein